MLIYIKITQLCFIMNLFEQFELFLEELFLEFKKHCCVERKSKHEFNGKVYGIDKPYEYRQMSLLNDESKIEFLL